MRLPADAWADYWLTNCVTSRGHTVRGVPWLASKEVFEKDLEASERSWIKMSQVRRTGETGRLCTRELHCACKPADVCCKLENPIPGFQSCDAYLTLLLYPAVVPCCWWFMWAICVAATVSSAHACSAD
jgi:hypothetical protein